MTEQIFKAWDNTKKEWVKYFNINPFGEVFLTQTIDRLSDKKPLDLILVRAIGREGMSNTKLFDGDIIRVGDHIGVISQHESGECSVLDSKGIVRNWLSDFDGYELEKIGNTFENLELLEAGE